MIESAYLKQEYVQNKRSVAEIADMLGCSQNKVTYWLAKHKIKKRSHTEASYVKRNRSGDPFRFTTPKTESEWLLYGLGVGLYWGEGNKANSQSVRIGNTDPALLRCFLDFLRTFYDIDESRLRFGLQLFSDIDPDTAKKFWCKQLNVLPEQFQQVVRTPSVQKGTYRKKSPHGVLSIYFSNTKLRASIGAAIVALQTTSYANVAQSVERIHGKSQDFALRSGNRSSNPE